MESMVFNAKVGKDVAIGVSSTITGGIVVPDNKFVPPRTVITTQEQADQLVERIGSPYEKINKEVVHVNKKFAEGYNKLDLQKIIGERQQVMEEAMLETGMPQANFN